MFCYFEKFNYTYKNYNKLREIKFISIIIFPCSYNRSKLSEEFEQLCTKYGQRYIGCETHSSCTVFENTMISPSKRKSTKLRWNTKSPGRRLSHLARRRITFTNPAIQNSGTSSSVVCSRARQILVDARRLELLSRKKSPKISSPRLRVASPRKTPRKSPRVKGRTPSSSTKKRLALQFRMYSENEKPVASTSSSTSSSSSFKRALFQSPEKETTTLPNACKCVIKKYLRFVVFFGSMLLKV